MLKKQSETSLPELTAILLARLGFLWLLVLVSLLLPNNDASFYAFMGIAFIITIPYSLWLRSKIRTSQFAPLQFIVDLVLVTGLVYFTGGVQSKLILLYPLVIISAGIVGTPKQAAEITILTIITYILMATLLSNRWIVEYLPTGITVEKSSGVDIFLQGVTFMLFGVAGIYISKRCNYIDAHQKELTETTLALISNIPSPAVLLDKEGNILFANDPLGELLNTDAEQMGASRFADWQAENQQDIPESFGHSTYLHRSNGNPIPVAYESRDFQLPETALLGARGRKNQEITITLLTITDISGALQNIHQLEKVERITAATHIAGEMAHEIRTPLTAISASVQLLRHYEASTTAADWLPNSPRRHDRKELFNHIEDASRQMDDVVKNFVDFAEFSPADLLTIIKLDSIGENKGYIGHLNTVGRGYKNGQNSDCG
ncbi:histidine kinase dimerization/phospho-acceptor domain-containing protein [Pontiellaceae bacterium B12227]|nr:histidine kinase dimerization/phospho-acceptor domain-containing protein [Pontiellaceae bacterium B12227]